MSLDGMTALVTGAGQNVGLGIAQALAEAGAAVAVNDMLPERSESGAEAVRAEGGKAIGVAFDVTDYQAVGSGVRQVEDELGPIDILVNNAGIPQSFSYHRFHESPHESWSPFLDLNLFGSLNTIHHVLAGMVERGRGRVIQISSGAGSSSMAELGASMYALGKAGMEAAIRQISAEVGPHGVTANALALGMMNNLQPRLDAGVEPIASIFKKNSVKRLGTPREIGAACVWLSEETGGYVNGQTIHINGGAVHGR